MPSGLIDEDGGVRARRDLRCNFDQVQLHRRSVATRHDEGCAFALQRTDRPEKSCFSPRQPGYLNRIELTPR
jgi:hypothetical protein